MPSTKVKDGLYWSDRTKTWHFEVRVRGKKHNGDTGHARKQGAVDFVSDLKTNLRRGAVGLKPLKKVPTLLAAFEAWDAAKKGVVVDAHRNAMRVAILTHCADELTTPISQLDNQVAEAIRTRYLASVGKATREGSDWQAEHSHTIGGANTILKLLSSLLGWCVTTERGITQRPFTLKRLKAQQESKGVVWPEQVQEFLAKVDQGGRTWAWKNPDKPRPLPLSATAIRLMLALGLREDEALNAKWQWLDRRRQVYRVGESKSRKIREVPVPEWLLEHLQQLHLSQGSPARGLILSAGKDKDGNQIPPRRGHTTKSVARVAELLEIADLTPHRLRATFATAHFEAGTPISQIQQMLGHEDPQTTMGYIVQRPKDQAEAQARVAAAMGFPNQSPASPQPKQKAKPKPLKSKRYA
jgi:integrase/recombinase XerC